MGGFKFEDYRQPWETGPHWELKREFMVKYSDMFTEDRLLCLAQAYSNIVLMNCSYPDPVMRQISLLAKPLEIRKKFQSGSDNLEGETVQNEDQRGEKMKAIYQKSGRPFKQIKFCSCKEEPAAVLQDSEIPSANLSQDATSMLPPTSSLPVVTQLQPEFISNIEDNKNNNAKSDGARSIESSSDIKRYNQIVSVLGLEFIQNFAQETKKFIAKVHSPLMSVMSAAQKLKIDEMIDFKIDPKPNCPPHTPIYCCQFIIKNCLISSEEANSKKKAKAKSAETAIDLLMKLSSDVSFQSKNNNLNYLNLPVNITEEPMDVNTLKGNCSKQFDTNKTYTVEMEMLQKLAKNIYPAVTPFVSLNRAVKKSNLAKCLQIKKSGCLQTSKCDWKLYLKDILISSVTADFTKRGKAELAQNTLDKLKDLSKYEIQNGELKEKSTNQLSKKEKSTNQLSKIELILDMNNSTKAETKNISKIQNLPFALNSSLFSSSMGDSFVLVNNLVKSNILKNSRTVLSDSASFCHKQFGYNFDFLPEGNMHKAEIYIGNIVVASGISRTKDEAKLSACDSALEMLRKRYYTLQVKALHSDTSNINRNQVYDANTSTSDALTDSNIGCKMLKSMGWSGGGLGTSGIAEPVGIDAQHSFGKGLGFAKKDEDYSVFKRRINSLLQELSKSSSLDDLLFSKEFSKEERKHIHQIAGRYKLHTVSRGMDNERFLVVRRKYSVEEILSHLQKVGGSDCKFQLLDASKDELNPFVFTEPS